MKEDMRRTSRARRAQQRKRRNRRIALTLCVMFVVLAASIGGTVAWLTAETDTITNTFTAGDINITLTETTGFSYKMVPGSTITKDPKVTVKADSEDCYLFVKIEESTNAKFSDFMTYEIDNTVWSPLTGVSGVYYRTVLAANTVKAFDVLKGNKVTVKEGVTKAQLNALTKETYPTLTFTAYAVQKANVDTVEAAWNLAKDL